ncbi:Zinc finger CCCH domain-containing protein [Actinidia chinensis var. chinensis]|uniref:Zinc finger CCCH domain-containing protein n=1 Tax=Actinidia chinensis var. chinensis TaxID=1590841 RepID=A0A2R6PDP1_ACTCC|nr:Zinc finger CCCH domain-containing protein [Actinidia chinensis var. chinensis]
MEPSEEHFVPNTHTHEHEPLHELRLGFQSSLLPSTDPNPSLDHPDDLALQTANEEHQNQQISAEEELIYEWLQNQQISVEEELQYQQIIYEGLQSQQISVEEELQYQQIISERLQNPQISVEEELQYQKIIYEELQNQQISGEEELQYQQIIYEGLQNLVLEEVEKLRVEVEVREENEANEEGMRRQLDAEREEDEHGDDGEESGGEEMGESKDGRYGRYSYPVRPDAEDCSFYMRTGTCKFGSNCKFNHPPRKKNQAGKENVKEKEESTERPGQTECKYYLRSGGCKYGKACRYNHSRGKTPVAPIAPIVDVNFLGLPVRPGEKECPYYMRNGSCKYGSNCRFNHPDPTAVGGDDAPSGYGNGGSFSSQGASLSAMPPWSSPRAVNETVPFVPVMFSPTQGLPSPNGDWNGYQAPVYQAPGRRLPTPPAFALSSAPETNFYSHHKQQMLVDEFPERPGRPQCTYYLKTGDCKYKSGCKYHHPKIQIPMTSTFALSDQGLPLRPDQNICSHYNRYGICKFGPACKFDHPVNCGPSTTSTGSGPDIDRPPPFGNSATTDGARMGRVEIGSEALMQ